MLSTFHIQLCMPISVLIWFVLPQHRALGEHTQTEVTKTAGKVETRIARFKTVELLILKCKHCELEAKSIMQPLSQSL